MTAVLLHGAEWLVHSAGHSSRGTALAIEGELIAAIGSDEELLARFPDAERIDCRGMIVTPGLVNPHNHVYEILGRGLGKDMTTEQWLRGLVYPVNDVLDDEDFYWGAILACADALAAGTTTMVEQLTNLARFHADAEFRAFRDSGLRARVARASSTASTIDQRENGEPDDEVAATAAYLDRWAGEDLVRPWVGPSGMFSCDPDTLVRLKQLANERGARFAIHLSETREQLQLAEANGYSGQIEWAHSLGLLDEQTVVAHAIWISGEEIELLRESDCHVVHNPTSNMLMTSGVAPVPAMLAAGVKVSIGSDGPSSNDAQDILAEMKMANLLQRAVSLDPTVLDARTCWRMGTEAGAEAVGLGGRLGRLEPGLLADIACFRIESNPAMQPVYDPVESLVYHGSGRDACITIVGGNVRHREGEFAELDLEQALHHVQSVIVPKVENTVGEIIPRQSMRSS
jgi:5-methylthioadenosine/S-adenosylhomocysteine deaminase